VPIEYNIEELSPLVKQAWIEALEGFETLGFKIIPISLPSTKAALSAYYVLAPAEAASNLAKYDGVRYGTRAEGTDGQNGVLFSKTRSEVKRRILLGSYTLSADAIDNYFIQAQKVRRKVQMEFNNVFAASHPLLEPSDDASANGAQEKVDYILCPTAPIPPPRLEDIAKQSPVEAYVNDVFTVPASLAGLPAISVPWGNLGRENPSKNIGLQIIGQYGHDKKVLDVAKQLQDMQKPLK
jgi:aspartyl-tRNA(Asn)/glutamyl-tRNA(Gln) amidotransferase subunit A